ncbi:hypothetical protein K443DRAFT_78501, partial [Laccaria amethystina LaAM-08-1]
MPVQSKVKQYTAEELDLALLSDKCFEKLGKQPFRWQLECALAILRGKDVVLDVGTGSGKTLCFSLPLVLSDKDIALSVSPLTALMVDQSDSAALKTIAVCQETISCAGPDKLYSDIVEGKFRQVLVSPEIAISGEFQKAVLAKDPFVRNLRVVNIDEAHCMNVWGGSFRPDYAALGL